MGALAQASQIENPNCCVDVRCHPPPTFQNDLTRTLLVRVVAEYSAQVTSTADSRFDFTRSVKRVLQPSTMYRCHPVDRHSSPIERDRNWMYGLCAIGAFLSCAGTPTPAATERLNEGDWTNSCRLRNHARRNSDDEPSTNECNRNRRGLRRNGKRRRGGESRTRRAAAPLVTPITRSPLACSRGHQTLIRHVRTVGINWLGRPDNLCGRWRGRPTTDTTRASASDGSRRKRACGRGSERTTVVVRK